MERLDRLWKFSKGDNKYFAPFFPIKLFFRVNVRIDRLCRFTRGNNRDYAPNSPT